MLLANRGSFSTPPLFKEITAIGNIAVVRNIAVAKEDLSLLAEPIEQDNKS
jgi:hypothetical protein